ncbi:hypothetical protein H4S08_003208, partial [Coemansia sp. RSA 1365]
DERDDEYAGVWHGYLADRSRALVGVSDEERSRNIACGAQVGELTGEAAGDLNEKYSDDNTGSLKLLSEWRQASLQ